MEKTLRFISSYFHTSVHHFTSDLLPSDKQTNPLPPALQVFMQSPCRSRLTRFYQSETAPAVVSDRFTVVWLTIPVLEEDSIQSILLLGPWMISARFLPSILQSIREAEMEETQKETLCVELYQIPKIFIPNLFTLAESLYTALNNLHRSPIDLRDIHIKPPKKRKTIAEGMTDSISRDFHFEQVLMDSIKNGKSFLENNGEFMMPSDKIALNRDRFTLRQCKDDYISILSLVSHAAIEGGMPEELAFMLGRHYEERVELCRTQQEINELWTPMEENFLYYIQHYKLQSSCSPPIAKCCKYIRSHLEKPFSLQEVADELSYHPYYLSGLFKKELHQSIRQFVFSEKIEKAKFLIQYSDSSLQEIGTLLCFPSQSSFSIYFKKYAGISPREYRQQVKG